jgi:hypothetical protein
MSSKTKITERALFARVKRKLAHDGLILRKCRENSQWRNDLGNYYAVDVRNCIAGRYDDLESEGRELGVLKAHEEIAA